MNLKMIFLRILSIPIFVVLGIFWIPCFLLSFVEVFLCSPIYWVITGKNWDDYTNIFHTSKYDYSVFYAQYLFFHLGTKLFEFLK